MPLPNLIIAGTNKAGTTSLWSYLAQHPDVGASDVKETCYWLPLRYDGEALPPLEHYRRHFAQWDRVTTSPPVIMESTPGYFYGGERIAQAIDEACPGVRIVIVLREPVSRLVSFFRFKQSQLELPIDMTLAQYVQRCRSLTPGALKQRDNNPFFGLEGGRYADYLPAWVERFADDRLRVVAFDDLKAHPIGVVSCLCEWLGLDAPGSLDTTPTNTTAGFRHAGLQRLALTVNRRGEKFFRKYPKFKSRIRTVYRRANGAAADQNHEDESEIRAELAADYQPANARLATQLHQRPDIWLRPVANPKNAAPRTTDLPLPAWMTHARTSN